MPKRFTFRLEGVLEYRKLLEDTKKKQFLFAKRARLEQEQHLTNLLALEEIEKKKLRELGKNEVDMAKLRLQAGYIAHISRWINNSKQELQKLQKIEEERKQEMIEATRRLKVLERLKEYQYKRYMYELGRVEQKVLDEIGQNMVAGVGRR
jgi:flagellar FliJ protein